MHNVPCTGAKCDVHIIHLLFDYIQLNVLPSWDGGFIASQTGCSAVVVKLDVELKRCKLRSNKCANLLHNKKLQVLHVLRTISSAKHSSTCSFSVIITGLAHINFINFLCLRLVDHTVSARQGTIYKKEVNWQADHCIKVRAKNLQL